MKKVLNNLQGVKILNIAYLLKKSREKSGKTQRQVAKEASVSRTYYSDIEQGRYNPSLKLFIKLAAILDIDMNILKDNNFDKS